MNKRWIVQKPETELVGSVVRFARIPYLLATLLVNRGFHDPEKARKYIEADFAEEFRVPSSLPGCAAVAKSLFQAIVEGKKIAVYGDYDVDGITATTILCKTIKDLSGKEPVFYIPSRLEGYGLNNEALQKLKDDGCELVVSVDCGITSVKKAEFAEKIGLELLITDHHNLGSELPKVVAMAHPQLVRYPMEAPYLVSPDSLTKQQLADAKKYPFTEICGAMVALKVALRMNDLAKENAKKTLETPASGLQPTGSLPSTPCQVRVFKTLSKERIYELIVLAMLGTVADCMPLKDENRVLVRKGLEILAAPGPVSVGVDALLQKIGKGKISEDFVSFQMTPRLNAAGRMDHAKTAAELLLCENQNEAERLVDEIGLLNEKRKTLQDWVQNDAVRQIEKANGNGPFPPAFVLQVPEADPPAAGRRELDEFKANWERQYNESWRDAYFKGVVGIVAGRIADKYDRPAILLAKTRGGEVQDATVVGSARSIKGFNLFEAVKFCDDLLVRCGGHDAAAGLTIKETNVDTFRNKFLDYIESTGYFEKDRKPELLIDGEFPLSTLTLDAVGQLSRLAPFGHGNPRPVFSARGVSIKDFRTMKDGQHFSANFVQGQTTLRGVAFNQPDWVVLLEQANGRQIDIAFQVQLNHYGRASVELTLVDWNWSD